MASLSSHVHSSLQPTQLLHNLPGPLPAGIWTYGHCRAPLPSEGFCGHLWVPSPALYKATGDTNELGARSPGARIQGSRPLPGNSGEARVSPSVQRPPEWLPKVTVPQSGPSGVPASTTCPLREAPQDPSSRDTPVRSRGHPFGTETGGEIACGVWAPGCRSGQMCTALQQAEATFSCCRVSQAPETCWVPIIHHSPLAAKQGRETPLLASRPPPSTCVQPVQPYRAALWAPPCEGSTSLNPRQCPAWPQAPPGGPEVGREGAEGCLAQPVTPA